MDYLNSQVVSEEKYEPPVLPWDTPTRPRSNTVNGVVPSVMPLGENVVKSRSFELNRKPVQYVDVNESIVSNSPKMPDRGYASKIPL